MVTTQKPPEIRVSTSTVDGKTYVDVSADGHMLAHLQIEVDRFVMTWGNGERGEYVCIKRPGREPGLFRHIPGGEPVVLYLNEDELK